MSKVLDLIGPAHGQCRLAYVSSSQIKLSPFNGRNLAIAGQLEKIPSAGITLAATGLTPGTVYSIYAYMNSGVMSLEASTTARNIDLDMGVAVKTGDTSRTFVGLAYCATGPAWITNNNTIGVVSYFNRRIRYLESYFIAVRGTTSTTAVELNSEIRLNFICLGDDFPRVRVNGGIYASTTGPGYAYIGVDAWTFTNGGAGCNQMNQVPFAAEWQANFSETALHFATIYAYAAAGGAITMTGDPSNAGGQRTTMSLSLMG